MILLFPFHNLLHFLYVSRWLQIPIQWQTLFPKHLLYFFSGTLSHYSQCHYNTIPINYLNITMLRKYWCACACACAIIIKYLAKVNLTMILMHFGLLLLSLLAYYFDTYIQYTQKNLNAVKMRTRFYEHNLYGAAT